MHIRKADRAVAMNRARAVNPSAFDRIMAAVNSDAPESCWNWTRTTSGGYGYLRVNGRKARANRVMHTMFYGDPGAREVRHLCNNPACVNPLHLRAGTHLENMADRKHSGRGGDLRGEMNGRSKLSDSDVRAIRASTDPTSVLVEKYNVSKVTICGIRRGAKWQHIN